jgi:hypothetical protein
MDSSVTIVSKILARWPSNLDSCRCSCCGGGGGSGGQQQQQFNIILPSGVTLKYRWTFEKRCCIPKKRLWLCYLLLHCSTEHVCFSRQAFLCRPINLRYQFKSIVVAIPCTSAQSIFICPLNMPFTYIIIIIFSGSAAQRGPWPPRNTKFLDHIQRQPTVGRTPLEEWSARRRHLYLTTHNTHNRKTSMPLVGFEPTMAGGDRP